MTVLGVLLALWMVGWSVGDRWLAERDARRAIAAERADFVAWEVELIRVDDWMDVADEVWPDGGLR